ncbi:MAG: IMP cyclohydrolase [Oscillospiraceae bacterium]|nr:IMP cyclohydrolase [Oscillospiraceae bacterium]
MEYKNFETYLSANAYPGRGILLGMRADGKALWSGYFIMGRSVNSRNRVFIKTEDGIRTQAFDPSKMADPSLIIYAPVRKSGNKTIVTNGDQTDTVWEHLEAGKSFEDALCTRTFEPDAPNYTPRISGLLEICPDSCRYELSILKSREGNPEGCVRSFFRYDGPIAGTGHLIHAYKQDGNPIPSFEGEPVPVSLGEDFDAFGEALWKALNEENKVSLYVEELPLDGSEGRTRIFNKNV